ncbi:outer membrane beta-barrel protein [Fulvivirga sp. M361]|uniref:outer membrane beta-barrel protein n=1 Tax=Fulvivirga sp. M361 TaxID=2594266 RepID=UPI00117A6CEA|nr:outer membrane beta-barrel protein [Fulvivirga sp. M361]TRX61424.1 outer membrane beta-barrel protein [Fulvivirga sp. M361]
MKKIILSVILSISTLYAALSQSMSVMVRTNISIGMDYQSLDFNGNELFYSPGGGIGIEGGLQLEMIERLYAYISVGYQLNLALQAENVNGSSNKTSFNFNRKLITLGAAKIIKLSENTVQGLILGAGMNYSIPGKIRIEENDADFGEISYESGFGFHLETGLRLRLSEGLYLDPSIRYRSLDLSGKSYNRGSFESLPDYLQELDASGLELGVTIVKTLK